MPCGLCLATGLIMYNDEYPIGSDRLWSAPIDKIDQAMKQRNSYRKRQGPLIESRRLAEENPHRSLPRGDGVGHRTQCCAGHLRQRCEVNDVINHLYHGIAKAAAGGIDNGISAIPVLQMRHKWTAGLLWEAGNHGLHRARQPVTPRTETAEYLFLLSANWRATACRFCAIRSACNAEGWADNHRHRSAGSVCPRLGWVSTALAVSVLWTARTRPDKIALPPQMRGHRPWSTHSTISSCGMRSRYSSRYSPSRVTDSPTRQVDQRQIMAAEAQPTTLMADGCRLPTALTVQTSLRNSALHSEDLPTPVFPMTPITGSYVTSRLSSCSKCWRSACG